MSEFIDSDTLSGEHEPVKGSEEFWGAVQSPNGEVEPAPSDAPPPRNNRLFAFTRRARAFEERLRTNRLAGRLGSLWLWLTLLPGVAQLVLLCTAMFGRWRYPYDLEWMEGGILVHAQRISDGHGIYVEPSADFIPFLYTPLYPGLLAMFGSVSYAAGRAVSIAATLGVCALLVAMVKREARPALSRYGWIGGACAVGIISATYPWVEGWYDLVRADSLFLTMVVGGLYGIRAWANDPGQEGMAKIAIAAALLGLSFFAKQTGVLFVAAGGLLLLLSNWRRLPIYVLVSGAIGLGGTWLLNSVTEGWFWVYIYETHQHHDFNMDRFYKSFGFILWHFPWMTVLIALAGALSGWTFLKRRHLPQEAAAFMLWLPIFAIAVVVGAVGWGTQFAHFNAYIPAMTFGALCAGLSIPAIAACIGALCRAQPGKTSIGPFTKLAGGLAATLLALQLTTSVWNPNTFIPSDADEQAGHELIRSIEAVEGDVLIPYHPWYAQLAGKETQVHLMGLRDMTTGKVWPIRGLRTKLQSQSYAMVVMDNRPIGRELHWLKRFYRMDDHLPNSSSPRVYTGAGAVWNPKVKPLFPQSVWVPNRPLTPPEGTRVLWSFEDGKLGDWIHGRRVSDPNRQRHKYRNNKAWGRRPVSGPLPKQGSVRRYGGRYYLSSFHGGDGATGVLRSPLFAIDGSTLRFRISGGSSDKLRAELRIDGQAVRSATGQNSERMEDVSWNVAPYAGSEAEIVLIDQDEGSWGHLNVDEFWMVD